jgi:ribosomal protein L22
MRDEMVVHAIRRLARQDIAKAVETWQLFHNEPVFTDEQQLKVARTLAAYMVRKPDGQLSRQLSYHLRYNRKSAGVTGAPGR